MSRGQSENSGNSITFPGVFSTSWLMLLFAGGGGGVQDALCGGGVLWCVSWADPDYEEALGVRSLVGAQTQ